MLPRGAPRGGAAVLSGRPPDPPADGPAVTVRPARAADARALGRLGGLLVRLHHDLDAARFLPATARTEPGYAAWLRAQLADANAVVLVAEREGELLGYAYAAVEGHDWMALRGPAGVLHEPASARRWSR